MKNRIKMIGITALIAAIALCFAVCNNGISPIGGRVTVIDGKGSGDYAQGATVTIDASILTGQKFKDWTTISEDVTFAHADSSRTTFTMPGHDVTVKANFELFGPTTYRVTVIDGTRSGDYEKDATVTIEASPKAGQKFKNWTTTSKDVTFANASSSSTTFTMPGHAVNVTANFESFGPTTFAVTVINGTGSGDYEQGATVTIKASLMTGQQFVNWTTKSADVSFANASRSSTTFTMPGHDVIVTAIIGQLGGGQYNVIFDSNGGTPVPAYLGVVANNTITEPTAPTRGEGYSFGGWYKEAALTTAWNFGSDTVNSNITLYAKWNLSLNIGDDGPGGGKIFYRSEAGFTMTDTGAVCHYLEAAPASISSALAWQTTGTNVVTSADIGTGRMNTSRIITSRDRGPAAWACYSYSNNNKRDWFLPSKDELNELNTQRAVAGIPDFDTYWSSSQYDTAQAWYQTFGSSVLQVYYAKYALNNVRAVRAF